MRTFLATAFLAAFALAFFLFRNSPTPYKDTGPLADPAVLQQLLLGKQPPINTDTYGQFHGLQVDVPALAQLRQVNRVLGTTTAGDKHIEVDLSKQRLYAFEGNQKVYDFAVSTGKWGPTPTGTYRIWVKLKSTLMSGGEGADYYYLPGVPWVQFFYNDQVAKSRGYSLHGAYWHNNFGHPMSHGCVNMRTEDAGTLFAWTNPIVTDPKVWGTYPTADNPGTEIVIYGTPPAE